MDVWDPYEEERSHLVVIDRRILCGYCNVKMIRIDENRFKCPSCGQNYFEGGE